MPNLDLDFDDSDAGKSPEQVEIARLQEELAAAQDKYIRSVAELENVQKRNAKERRDLLAYAGEKLAYDILESVDDLDRACTQGQSMAADELLKGVTLIRDSFNAALQRHGIKSEESLGQVFDPNKHEALASVPTADAESGTIIEQFKRLYHFKDKLLRPAQVVVAVAPQATEDDA
ncbi:UNVERIFIED_CONTAM: hypothetical protein GTU68_010443 [Idotea baltica]|nr:hypothetical protein [Idotea baltica]